ncbi:MAG: carboxylesterase family protein [Alicyclobacillus sp.]|nr:carboxylesterase family protein [Alicyclobacillus sp.]
MKVETRCGVVQGARAGAVWRFAGIPYAAPPVGPRRFQPPAPPIPWTGLRSAVAFGPMAPQPAAPPLLPRADLPQSEDCLTLNVWTPAADSGARPVLVWVHGGGLTSGSSADVYSDGARLAENGDLVFVSMNYRLGALGFLHLATPSLATSGNCGLLDVIAALRWVQENIAAFGGDPGRVTVGGVSAGAKLVAALFAAPQADGLFRQAVLQSGAAQTVRDAGTAQAVTRAFLRELELDHADLETLRGLPLERLLGAQERLGTGARGLHLFGPVLDGVTLSSERLAWAGRPTSRDVRVLLGSTRREAQIYTDADPLLKAMDEAVLRRLFGTNTGAVLAAYHERRRRMDPEAAAVEVLSECLYGLGTERFADELAKQGIPVWRYRFDWEGVHGPCHAQDIPFFWNQSGPADPFIVPPTAASLADAMHRALIAFVQSGCPQIPDLPKWPVYTFDERAAMCFDKVCSVRSLPRTSVRNNFLERAFVCVDHDGASPTGCLR